MNTSQVTAQPPVDPLEYEAWLDGIVSLPEGAQLRGGISISTFKREAKAEGQLLDISKRRKGVRRRYALMRHEPPRRGRK